MGRWFEPSRPRQAKGGIKSQSKAGSFGANWWAKRWIATLESFDMGSRLTRGRSYARAGQVLSISIESGLVRAKVQGSQSKPYGVDIHIQPLSEIEWMSVADALSEQAIFAAKLMAGEMPETIEEVFQGVGLSLLPKSLSAIETDCTCPDWSNPCKHIAAVYYLLGEEFDRDPFLIFRLRGITREAFLALLSERGGETLSEASETSAPMPPEPLRADSSDFWGAQPLPEDFWGEVTPPPVPAALVRRLGNFPFWQGDQPLLDSLTPLYTQASRHGLSVVFGETDTPKQD